MWLALGAVFRGIPLSWWLIGALLASHGIQGWRIDRIKSQRDEAITVADGLESVRREAEETAQADKVRVVKAHEVIVKDLSDALNQTRRTADRLKRDSVGLRDAAETLRQRVEAAVAAGRSEAASDALRVHAVVLEQCRSQLAAVAGHADESRARGLACVSAYDELTR